MLNVVTVPFTTAVLRSESFGRVYFSGIGFALRPDSG